MKVVHIITGLNNGGAEGVLYRLVTHDEENEHIIISMMDLGKYGPLLLERGLDVYCLNMKAGGISLASIYKLRRYLRRIDPDVVQTWMYHADLIGGIVAKSLGIKKIFWNIRHSNFDENHTKASTIKIAKINARLSKVIPKKIISCAQGAIKAHTDLGYDREKIVVIGNGYDLSTFNINSNSRSAIREELNIGKHPVLGMVGRYDPQKNHEGLLEALSLIKKQGYNFDLVLVGRDLNEKNKELLHKIKKLDLYDQVHLLDQRSDIPNIMNALDIHILSSSYGEGFPNVIAEAMACGTPCIATDIGDSAVIIGDSGWIVSENNSEELANAIIKGFQEKENEQKWAIKIKSARKRILDNFDIEIMVEKYNNVWKK
jgi:glycosyltransferase involved in cell wall biosynthesis